MVAIGDPAPEFEAPIAGGGSLKLSSLRGSPVVLYFYPAADTPGCTMESKGFRDIYSDLKKKHVAVVGVSTDDVPAQENFAGKYDLPFPLVADTAKRVAEAYGVLGPGGRARRVTFFIDAHGKVVDVVDERPADPHVNRARERFLSP